MGSLQSNRRQALRPATCARGPGSSLLTLGRCAAPGDLEALGHVVYEHLRLKCAVRPSLLHQMCGVPLQRSLPVRLSQALPQDRCQLAGVAEVGDTCCAPHSKCSRSFRTGPRSWSTGVEPKLLEP